MLSRASPEDWGAPRLCRMQGRQAAPTEVLLLRSDGPWTDADAHAAAEDAVSAQLDMAVIHRGDSRSWLLCQHLRMLCRC